MANATETRRTRRVGVLATFVIALAVLCSACTSDWAQWGGNGTTRQGWSDFGVGINPRNANRLQHKWSVDLGGYINASPILATGLDVNGTVTDVIYVGTERGGFYAVSGAGRVLWSRNLGSVVVPNCNDTPGAVFGVSASAAFDRQRNAVFVEGGDGQVYALNPVTGATLPGWPVRLTTIPNTEVVFGAPTLVRNHLYYVIAAHCDTIPYHGRVVDIDLNARAIAHTFYVTGSASGPYGGGIWGWGGASVDPANGDVYVATGNS